MKFPIPVRKTIALQTVTFLLKDTTDLSKVLTSQKNVETVMEAMGQAFSLTMEVKFSLDFLRIVQFSFFFFRIWM